MKRFLTLLMALTMMLTMAACGGEKGHELPILLVSPARPRPRIPPPSLPMALTWKR